MTRLRTLYRRITATTRVVPLLALLATTAALVAFVIQYPAAAMWAVVVALVLALAGMVTLVVEVNDTTDWANAAEERAVQAEHLVDALDGEAAATHAANEILVAELACADGTIHHLQNDLIAAHKRLSDYENGAEVIAFPSQREASPYDWPQNSDDDWFSRLYNENGDLR